MLVSQIVIKLKDRVVKVGEHLNESDLGINLNEFIAKGWVKQIEINNEVEKDKKEVKKNKKGVKEDENL
jgi:hypothetical protein